MYIAISFQCFIALPQKGYHPFVIDGVQVGLVRAEFLKYLLQYPDVFQFQSEYVVLNPTLKNYVDRTKKVDAVLRNLRSQNVVSTLSGWRDEVRVFYSFETC